MDDEAKQLLREIREILSRSEARNAEWIDENRALQQARNSIWHRTGALAIAILFMLVVLLEIVILGRVYGVF
jgi:CHASE3 domain sensor protein